MLSELKLELLKFNSIEKSIIQARINGDAICDIDKKQLNLLSDVSIFRIAAIVGFSLPTSEKFADILNEELLTLLNDFGYAEITFDELILAFRINAQGNYRTSGGDIISTVNPYSTFFSINYAASVLNNYMRIRRNIEYKINEKSAIEISEKYTK